MFTSAIQRATGLFTAFKVTGGEINTRCHRKPGKGTREARTPGNLL